MICLSFHPLLISQSPSAGHFALASLGLSEALRRVVDPSVNWMKCHNNIKGLSGRLSQVEVKIVAEGVTEWSHPSFPLSAQISDPSLLSFNVLLPLISLLLLGKSDFFSSYLYTSSLTSFLTVLPLSLRLAAETQYLFISIDRYLFKTDHWLFSLHYTHSPSLFFYLYLLFISRCSQSLFLSM